MAEPCILMEVQEVSESHDIRRKFLTQNSGDAIWRQSQQRPVFVVFPASVALLDIFIDRVTAAGLEQRSTNNCQEIKNLLDL